MWGGGRRGGGGGGGGWRWGGEGFLPPAWHTGLKRRNILGRMSGKPEAK